MTSARVFADVFLRFARELASEAGMKPLKLGAGILKRVFFAIKGNFISPCFPR